MIGVPHAVYGEEVAGDPGRARRVAIASRRGRQNFCTDQIAQFPAAQARLLHRRDAARCDGQDPEEALRKMLAERLDPLAD